MDGTAEGRAGISSIAPEDVSLWARPAARHAKDVLARWVIAAGGMGVIVAISLIFFYLLWVVLPLFEGASIERAGAYTLPAAEHTDVALTVTDEVGVMQGRLHGDGSATYLRTEDGTEVARIAARTGLAVLGVYGADPVDGTAVLLLEDGSVLQQRLGFEVSYPDGVRSVVPALQLPLGEAPLQMLAQPEPVLALALRSTGSDTTAAAVTEGGDLLVRSYRSTRNFLTGATVITPGALTEIPLTGVLDGPATHLLIDPTQRWLYVADDSGDLAHYQLEGDRVELLQILDAVPGSGRLTSMGFLLGGYSLLLGDDRGHITQMFPVRDETGVFQLQAVRSFELGAAISTIRSEKRRKGFVAATVEGELGIFHATSDRELIAEQVSEGAIERVTLSPRGRVLLVEDRAGELVRLDVENEHPEVSWDALWSEVHYESFDQPEHIWQSSAADNDFEPKFSLAPLAFGTLKAAFYAMLFAVPLAIFGAMYTAYFMTPGMRRLVKPTIEIMGALPTVILGFLAGLWLAPFAEANLAGLLLVLVVLPLVIPVFGFLWQYAPAGLRYRIGEGRIAALLIPVICLVTWGVFSLGSPIEHAWFDGSLAQWLTSEAGIDFDQRNALIVGIAMGFMVIPTIFSIAEDALFGVPKHLAYGSLALGATQWQTLVRVVLPTASPGIFSAVMIGLGRAVGETMIVLMATGNTPIMDANIFEGMRTLSANIAVEMPESEVGSTHYRILFLAGLVLFTFTFIVNTGAEIIRQRLRRKYANL